MSGPRKRLRVRNRSPASRARHRGKRRQRHARPAGSGEGQPVVGRWPSRTNSAFSAVALRPGERGDLRRLRAALERPPIGSHTTAALRDHPVTGHGRPHDPDSATQVGRARLQRVRRVGGTSVAFRGCGRDLQEPMPAPAAARYVRSPGALLSGERGDKPYPEGFPVLAVSLGEGRAELRCVNGHLLDQRDPGVVERVENRARP